MSNNCTIGGVTWGLYRFATEFARPGSLVRLCLVLPEDLTTSLRATLFLFSLWICLEARPIQLLQYIKWRRLIGLSWLQFYQYNPLIPSFILSILLLSRCNAASCEPFAANAGTKSNITLLHPSIFWKRFVKYLLLCKRNKIVSLVRSFTDCNTW